MQHCSCIEHGRLVNCQRFAKKYNDGDGRNAFQQQISENPCVGWMRDIPDENHPRTCREARLRRWVSEGQDWAEDVWAFCRRKRRSYTKVLEPYIRIGWRQLGGMCLQWNDDKTTLPPPTHPTKDNVHLGIFSNLSTERLEETHESFGPRSLFFLIMNYLTD